MREDLSEKHGECPGEDGGFGDGGPELLAALAEEREGENTHHGDEGVFDEGERERAALDFQAEAVFEIVLEVFEGGDFTGTETARFDVEDLGHGAQGK